MLHEPKENTCAHMRLNISFRKVSENVKRIITARILIPYAAISLEIQKKKKKTFILKFETNILIKINGEYNF